MYTARIFDASFMCNFVFLSKDKCVEWLGNRLCAVSLAKTADPTGKLDDMCNVRKEMRSWRNQLLHNYVKWCTSVDTKPIFLEESEALEVS